MAESDTRLMLPLPDVPRVTLTRPPLVLVVCQVQFSDVLSVADPAQVAPFQRAIQAMFPLAKHIDQVFGLQVQVGPGSGTIQPGPPTYQWEFADRDNVWKVVLAQSFVSLETRMYADFGDFLDRMRLVLEAVAEHIRPPIGKRIGLRYINEIRMGGHSLTDVISGDLLGPLAEPAFAANTSQVASIQQVILRYPNNDGITINHGLVPSGTTLRLRPGEEPPPDRFYLLDIDVYREFPPVEGLAMEPGPIGGYVEAYHRVIYRLFRWAVTEQHLARLEAGQDAHDD